jgi:hypothetical protein
MNQERIERRDGVYLPRKLFDPLRILGTPVCSWGSALKTWQFTDFQILEKRHLSPSIHRMERKVLFHIRDNFSSFVLGNIPYITQKTPKYAI